MTNNPSIVTRSSVIPGVSDHGVVLVESNVSAKSKPQIPRKIHLYKKSDWDGFRSHVTELHNSLSMSISYEDTNVQELWEAIVSSIEKGIGKFIMIY